MAERQLDGADAILGEARKTKETAERMANGEGPPGEADDPADPLATAEWARRWPIEEVWKARKKRVNDSGIALPR